MNTMRSVCMYVRETDRQIGSIGVLQRISVLDLIKH